MKSRSSDESAWPSNCILILGCLGALVSSCGKREQMAEPPTSQPSAQRQVAIAAAADLKFALDDIIAAFRRQHAEIDVKAMYGSSGSLFAQLSNGAPFDLFLSADMEYPRRLVEQGFALGPTLFRYALGRIVIWVPNNSPLDLPSHGLQSLLAPSVRKVAIANPTHAPYGRAAEAAMKKLGVYEGAKPRLVLAENIVQAAQFVESGAADIGIIASSLAIAPPMRDRGRYWEVPLDAYPRIEQGGVILRQSRDENAARLFREFMLGQNGRAILNEHGFSFPEN